MAPGDAAWPRAEESGRASAPSLPRIKARENAAGISSRNSFGDLFHQLSNPTVGSMNSSESPWLQRFAHLKRVRKPDQQRPWKATPDQSRDIIASVQCILDRENCFVREVDRYVRHHDFLELRRTEMLYKKWLEDVSEPLLQKIKDEMDSQSEKAVHKRRQEQFSQYLNYCRKKGYVSLEHYDPSEYDPFF